MTLDAATLAALREKAEKATPGGWQFIEDAVPSRLGGSIVERTIHTAWDHGQLRGPAPIVSLGVTVGQDGKARYFVHIGKDDAAHIAAASPDVVLALVAEIERLREDYGALEDSITKLTRTFDEHPDDYDGPCECPTCLSYADESEAT